MQRSCYPNYSSYPERGLDLSHSDCVVVRPAEPYIVSRRVDYAQRFETLITLRLL